MNRPSDDIYIYSYVIFRWKFVPCDCAKDPAIKREKRDALDIRLIENSFSPVYYPLTFFERVTVFKPFASVRHQKGKKVGQPAKIDFRSRDTYGKFQELLRVFFVLITMLTRKIHPSFCKVSQMKPLGNY